MTIPPNSRYAQVSRRTLLRYSAGLGLAALVPGLTACGNNDQETLAGSGQATTTNTGAEETTASTSTSTTTSSSTPETTVDSTAPTDGGPAIPEGAELFVAFTYDPAPGGKNLPPYVAVWVEDTEGNLVNTIALWYQQDRKGTKWLPDLKRWFSTDQTRIESGGDDLVPVISSATRLAGSYVVAWDGTDIDGEAVMEGSYFIAIESARERGPYSLIREPIALTGQQFETSLPDETELTSASVAVV